MRAAVSISVPNWFRSSLLVIGFGLTLSASPTMADDARPPTTRGVTSASASDPSLEAMARIHAIRTWKVVQALRLERAATATLGPILRRHDRALIPLLIAEQRLREQSDILANAAGSAAARQGAELLDQLIANRRKLQAAQDARFQDVRGVLSPQQALTLFGLFPELDRELQRRVCAQSRVLGLPEGLRQNPFE